MLVQTKLPSNIPNGAPNPKDLLKKAPKQLHIKKIKKGKGGREKISPYMPQAVGAATGITSLFTQKLNPIDTKLTNKNLNYDNIPN